MRLNQYLEARGESQTEFGARAGISPQVVSNICRGTGCHSTTAKAIIEATGGLVTIDDLQPVEAA